MNRCITADERKPQPGDILQTCFDGIVIIQADHGHAALVLWGCSRPQTGASGYLTRLGWSWIRGGWQGMASSRPYYVRPAYYLHRADGGSLTHPIDAGVWV